jgi:hypothetical protein
MTASGGEQLVLVARNGRVKHHLAGRPLHGGDPVDLCFSGGWVTGRYEWSGDVSEPPRFHYSLELAGEGRVAEGAFDLPEGALLRWPSTT